MGDKPQHNAIVSRNRQLAKNLYDMELSAPALASSAKPGQFLMLSLGEGITPFLRRPFGIAGLDPAAGLCRIVYQVAGQGTALMSRWEAGRPVDILGPLGRGFALPEEVRGPVVLVGGGMGIAPLLPLAQALRTARHEVAAFFGGASLERVFGLKQLGEWGCRVQVATEDGSAGFSGLITLPLERYFAAATGQNANADGQNANAAGQVAPIAGVYACGPTAFLRAVAGLCQDFHLPAQISLEERMACGLGVCMGCAVSIREPDGGVKTRRVCYDGPVFDAGKVVFHG